ncbi:MAG TPA: helix-turn-helix domain-containing protein [Thermoanaerobaculia bacterium]|nr:helix-turn-helix domain-containing protein [Thermoanaerobaculia bacterium]
MLRSKETAETRGTFGGLLRRWRHHRGFSQLDLAHQAELSPRHLSFLENGRANPSRAMIVKLSETLTVPLRERNRLLLSAGYAPGYSESSVDGPEMAQVRAAIDALLERHAPYPAYAMDGAWNVIAANRWHRMLVELLVPRESEGAGNILKLVFDPRLLRPHIENWDDCATVILRRVARQLSAPHPHPELEKIFAEIRGLPGVAPLAAGALDPGRSDLFIPIALRFGDRVVRWMTTVLTFGAAIDVTLEELVVECVFPADAESEAIYAAFAASVRK